MKYRIVLLGLAVACGDSTSPQGSLDSRVAGVDGRVDSGVDAPPQPGVIHVELQNGLGEGPAAPFEGGHIVFYNPDGSTAANATTDAEGKASGVVLPGATVVATQTSGTHTLVQIVVGAAPNDTLQMGAERAADLTTSGTVKFTIPSIAGAQPYAVWTTCGTAQGDGQAGATTTVEMSVLAGCTSFKGIAFADVANEGRRAVDIPATTVVLGSTIAVAALPPRTSVDYQMSNLPDAVTSASAQVWAAAHNHLDVFDSQAVVAQTDPGASLTLSMPTVNAGERLTIGRIATATSEQFRYAKTATTTSTSTWDATFRAPWVTAVAVDATARKVSWQQSSDGNASLIAIWMGWTVGEMTYTVELFAPAPTGSSSLTLPAVSELAALPTDTASVNTVVRLIRVSNDSDWSKIHTTIAARRRFDHYFNDIGQAVESSNILQ